MAQDALKPKDKGRLTMPRPDGAMNKIAPKFGMPDDKGTMLGYDDGAISTNTCRPSVYHCLPRLLR